MDSSAVSFGAAQRHELSSSDHLIMKLMFASNAPLGITFSWTTVALEHHKSTPNAIAVQKRREQTQSMMLTVNEVQPSSSLPHVNETAADGAADDISGGTFVGTAAGDDALGDRARAQLRRGDVLIAVNDLQLQGLSFDAAVDVVRRSGSTTAGTRILTFLRAAPVEGGGNISHFPSATSALDPEDDSLLLQKGEGPGDTALPVLSSGGSRRGGAPSKVRSCILPSMPTDSDNATLLHAMMLMQQSLVFSTTAVQLLWARQQQYGVNFHRCTRI